jgi:hypothetical protein
VSNPLSNVLLCGECHCLVPATKWFGHRFYHEAQIRMGLLSAGFTEAGADEAAKRAAESIAPDLNWRFG